MRTAFLNQGHQVSVFATEVDPTHTDARIYRIRPTLVQHSLMRFNRKIGGRSYYFAWANAIATTINTVHRMEPLDILEMEESFGWCATVQKHVTTPIVVKLHGPAFLTLVDEDLQTKLASTKISREGVALREMHTLTAPSHSVLRATVAKYGLRPTIGQVIPNPIAIEPDLKQWNVHDADRKTVLFVGRFDRTKGGDIMLALFKRLLEADSTLKLVFVGPDVGLASQGGGRIFLEAFVNRLFTEEQKRQITYLGALPWAGIHDLRTRAMVTVVPSRWENQPNTVLEAMAQGCPVVAVDVGGIAEIVDDGVTGLIARGNDLKDLSQKVIDLLSNPDKAEALGANARRVVLNRHSPANIAATTVDLYQRAISAARQPR